MIPLGIVILAVIVVPWYAALYHEHGWTYIKSFLISENVERFTSGVGVQQHRGPWFYLPIVLSDSFPLSLLLPCAAAAAWKTRTRIETLLWCWIAAIVGFFSLSVAKQDLYIFPIVSAVAALGGVTIARGLTDERWKKWVSATLAVAGALLALAGGAVLALFETAGRVYALDAALMVGAIGLAGGVIAHGLRRRSPALGRRADAPRRGGRRRLGVRGARPPRVRALQARPRVQPGAPGAPAAGGRRDPLPGLAAEHGLLSAPARGTIRRRSDRSSSAILSDQHVYAILSADDYQSLAPQIAARTCIIDRRQTFEVKLRQVIARQPLPELC